MINKKLYVSFFQIQQPEQHLFRVKWEQHLLSSVWKWLSLKLLNTRLWQVDIIWVCLLFGATKVKKKKAYSATFHFQNRYLLQETVTTIHLTALTMTSRADLVYIMCFTVAFLFYFIAVNLHIWFCFNHSEQYQLILEMAAITLGLKVQCL